jgi:L,D-peptidoglycan transpeptidase YkuD (ErfK/YbiS/YcfS/YnhG family)
MHYLRKITIILATAAITILLSALAVFADDEINQNIGTDANVPQGVYSISSKLNPGLVLDIEGNSDSAGANLRLWDANGTEAQEFIITPLGDGTYTICGYGSGLSLDIAGGSSESGSNVQQYRRNGSNAQLFKILRADDSYVSIQPLCTDCVFDVCGGEAQKGTNIWTYARNESDAQKFLLKSETTHPMMEGTYFIHCGKTFGNCLGVADDTALSPVASQACAFSDLQEITITYSGSDLYTIALTKTGMVFDVEGGNAVSGTRVNQYPQNGTPAQKWKISDLGNGYYSIASSLDGQLYLTAGANSSVEENNGSENQVFSFEAIDKKQNVADGCYTFLSGLDEGKTVDISGGSFLPGANIQIYESNDTDAQKFFISYQGNGYYAVTSAKTGMAIDVCGGSSKSGANIWQYDANHSMAQMWRFESNGNTGYKSLVNAQSSMAMDVCGAVTDNGTNIWQYDGNGSSAQLFKLVSTEPNTKKSYHIDVRGEGTTCQFNLQKIENGEISALVSCSGWIGSNGLTDGSTRVAGNRTTPTGTYTLGNAYGINDNPGSNIPYEKIDSNMYWCGNINLPVYNTLQRTTDGYVPCADDEHLIDYPGSYNYLIDIGYNADRVPGIGSAIFLHCSHGSPTAGCIAIPQEDMIAVLNTIVSGTTITIH